MRELFCSGCMADREVTIESRRECLSVRDTDVEVESRIAICTACGEDVWDDELADETLSRAFDEYRRAHGLLSPHEMARIRTQWGLGQRAFSLLLGWGEITLHRYESGSIQDSAHDAQMRMAENPENIRILIEANGDRLTPRQYATVSRRLEDALGQESAAECGDQVLEQLLAREATGQYGGDTPLSMAKVREAIVYFCSAPDMWVTKLAKMLFYSDFLHYKLNTTSITGLAYAHLPRGPVPEHYELIRADLLDNSAVRIEERNGTNWSGEVVVAERAPDLSVFTPSELQVLESVRSRLAGLTSKAISKLSHSETAYAATTMGERIPYETAADLNLGIE